jgi:hypothetical protein
VSAFRGTVLVRLKPDATTTNGPSSPRDVAARCIYQDRAMRIGPSGGNPGSLDDGMLRPGSCRA